MKFNSQNGTNKAIVFNCNFNGLSIIQELGRRGVSCIAMDCSRSIGTYSRYAKYVKCADPAGYESRFIDQLYELCKKEKEKPVLFPTNDIWAQAIARNKTALSAVSIPCVSNQEVVELVLDKQKFYELGNRNSYLTPRTYTLSQVMKCLDIDFPIIAKPNARRSSSDHGLDAKLLETELDRLRLTKIYDKRALETFLTKEKDYLPFLIFQQLIMGVSDQMFTVGVYADVHSDLIGTFTGRKVRGYPAEYGDCIVGEVYQVPDRLIENTAKIVKELKYKGIAEFEYKRHEMTGVYYLIEINPRSWSWIGITPACGVSLPWLAYTDLLKADYDGKHNCKHLKNGEVKYVKYLEDFDNCINNYKKHFPLWHMGLKQWKNSLACQKLVKAEFSPDDITVSLASIKNFIVNKTKRLIKRT
ncbi:hypothetical protein ACFOET_05715 [Parapedobacter deserti]|uniref:ATP-grasp domain-containing protein n=1 Tax=Parapedobacter deserti TaxID=1912957 RepID=A0ABV7JJU0_9SPHI